jgi:hypothetical protein
MVMVYSACSYRRRLSRFGATTRYILLGQIWRRYSWPRSGWGSRPVRWRGALETVFARKL